MNMAPCYQCRSKRYYKGVALLRKLSKRIGGEEEQPTRLSQVDHQDMVLGLSRLEGPTRMEEAKVERVEVERAKVVGDQGDHRVEIVNGNLEKGACENLGEGVPGNQRVR